MSSRQQSQEESDSILYLVMRRTMLLCHGMNASVNLRNSDLLDGTSSLADVGDESISQLTSSSEVSTVAEEKACWG
ncbi:hypothetical protein BGX26_006926 [Mortierella sp. AD094]|nr:hypothetical protein BGX26_006926 [Mortierella sp. AD094]